MASSTQEPSVDILRDIKMKLAGWLSADFQFILQHAHCGRLVDDRVYKRLVNTVQPEDASIVLIDSVMTKGDKPSSDFLQLLKKPEIHSTYNSQLKDWILALPGPTEPQRANRFVAGPSEPQSANNSLSDAEKKLFFKKHRGKLVDNVKNVGRIVDDLETAGLNGEIAAGAHADNTNQARVRRILDSATSKRARNALFSALLEHESGVMEDLLDE